MDSHNNLYRDTLGKYYQIIRPPAPAHSSAKRKTFSSPELTKRFVRSLDVPRDFWRRFIQATGRDGLSARSSDNDILDHIAERLVAGSILVYEFPPLEKHALRDGKGAAFSFAKGPDPLPTDGECIGGQDASDLLGGLRASPAFWHEMLSDNGFILEDLSPDTASEADYQEVIDGLLASGVLLMYKTPDTSSKPKSGSASGESESAANTPGNRVAHSEAPPQSAGEEEESVRDANGVLRTPDGRFAVDTSLERSGLQRPSLRSQTKAEIEANAPRDSSGQFVDQNGNVISDYHYGHITGHENRRILAAGDELGLNQEQLNDYVNARPQFFKIEDAKRNLSHVDELPGRDNIDHIIIDMEDFFGL